MSWGLEAILDYNMDELESKAFRLSLLWELLSEKEFPTCSHIRLRKNGDPRKSLLFKVCYKLVKETKGLIKDSEYRLYLLSQLHVLKHVSENTRIDPSILVGKKAWHRWKLWRYHYTRNIEGYRKTVEDTQSIAPKIKVITAIKSTKKFLIGKFQNISYEVIENSLKDHSMVKWVTLHKVSPYYVILSPWVTKILENKKWEDVFLFDLTMHTLSITPEIRKFFKEEFAHEFN